MIDRLAMLQAEGEQAVLAVRRRLAEDPHWTSRALVTGRRWLDEVVVLATCERVEVYGIASASGGPWSEPNGAGSPSAASSQSLVRELLGDEVTGRIVRGPAAARHLLRVAAGLESRIVGETHVLGQVAECARTASAARTLGPLLARLFGIATRTGRRVRAETELGRLAGSYVNATAQRIVAGAGPAGTIGIIGIIGSGALARDLVVEFERRGVDRVVVFARHPESFRKVAHTAAVAVEPLDALPSQIDRLDALVAATSSPRVIVGGDLVLDRARPLVVVDLGLPANVDDSIGEAPNVELVRLADLAGPSHAAEVVAAAESIVDAELDRFLRPARSVILAAHGAGDDTDANRRVEAIRAHVAHERPKIEVLAAFNLGSPRFDAAVDASTGDHVTVIPMMTSQGHFVRERLPAALGQAERAATVPMVISPPVGAVRSLVAAVVGRTVAAAAQATGAVGVIVVGHGTRRTRGSGDATVALATEIAEALPDASVTAAFLDEPPLLEDVAAAIAQPTLIVVPWLLGGGDHAKRDVGERIAEATRNRPWPTRVATLPALADDEAIADLVKATLGMVDWHAPDRVHRVGTRPSPLARRQTAMAVEAMTIAGLRTTVVEIATRGDLDQRTPLHAFDSDGVFTDELESALAEGAIDLAVHSLKDLPLREGRDTIVAAVLHRGSAEEVLVTRDGSTLATLPAGARIGTSSARRTAQLFAERSDLVMVPLRGPVDGRLASIAEGRIDGAILAAAGLERLGAIDRISERLPLERFLPEAGQGAIAITARVDDSPAIAACGGIDHGPTRVAVEAERAASRAVQAHAGWIAAAHAVVDGALRLRVRAIDRTTRQMRDAVVDGSTVAEAVERAMAALVMRNGASAADAIEAACASTRGRRAMRPNGADASESARLPVHRVLAHEALSPSTTSMRSSRSMPTAGAAVSAEVPA